MTSATDTMDSLLITEVGPRDGLQNLSQPVSLELRTWLVDALSQLGLARIEAGSFVSQKAVPCMAGSDKLFQAIQRHSDTAYMALVPNLRGAETALTCGADRLAVFTAASETFCQKNIGCSISQSLERFNPVFELAGAHSVPVRAYISCVSGCPYEGSVNLSVIGELAANLYRMGADEICLADTTGVGNPAHTQTLVEATAARVGLENLALHMHDTYGTGLVNCWAGYRAGIRSFDTSIAGLGGCPFAPGAAGNLATEDLLYLFHQCGIDTGIDLYALAQLGIDLCQKLELPNRSRCGKLLTNRTEHATA